MAQSRFSRLEPLYQVDNDGDYVRRLHSKPHTFAVKNIGYDVSCVIASIVPLISAVRFTHANMPDAIVVAIGELGDTPPNHWIESEIIQEFKKYDDSVRLQFFKPGESVYDMFAKRMEDSAPNLRFAGFVTFLIPMGTGSLS